MRLPFQNRTVICLDDDPLIHRVIEASLDVKCVPVTNLAQLAEELTQQRPIAVFVDIHLGTAESGLTVVPHLKARWPFAPVFVMTSDPNARAVAEALDSGADDFVRKPLNPDEVKARFQARLEDQFKKRAASTISVGELILDTAHRVLRYRKKETRLSPTACSILETLFEAGGTARSREVLKRRAWGRPQVSDNALDRKIHEVRAALRNLTEDIELKSIYGQGFLLETRIAQSEV